MTGQSPPGEMLAALELAGRHGGRVIKGLALRELYEQPELRHEATSICT